MEICIWSEIGRVNWAGNTWAKCTFLNLKKDVFGACMYWMSAVNAVSLSSPNYWVSKAPAVLSFTLQLFNRFLKHQLHKVVYRRGLQTKGFLNANVQALGKEVMAFLLIPRHSAASLYWAKPWLGLMCGSNPGLWSRLNHKLKPMLGT